MNKYTARGLWLVFWLSFFLLLGIVDFALSETENAYTLSKVLLWLQSKSAVTYFGLVFMMGYLVAHLNGSTQDPLPVKGGDRGPV